MTALEAGDLLPDVSLESTDGPVTLHDLLEDGSLLILFYQEDSTPLCTTQLCAFRDDLEMLDELDASVVAISVDDVASHAVFADTYEIPFPLLSDPELAAATAFGVVDEAARRAQRAAFVCDPQGEIVLAIPFYQPVNFEHYQAVFEALGLDL